MIKAEELRREHKNITIIEQNFTVSNSEIQNSQLGTFDSKLSNSDEIKK